MGRSRSRSSGRPDPDQRARPGPDQRKRKLYGLLVPAEECVNQKGSPGRQELNRLRKELARSQEYSPFGIAFREIDGDLAHWKASLEGPCGTPYEGGSFEVDIQFVEYPYKPPKIVFDTVIWHPNISWKTGAICMDSLFEDQWSPVLQVSQVLLCIQSLLGKPEPNDPLEPEVARMYKQNHIEFTRMAVAFTQAFAGNKAMHVEDKFQALCDFGFDRAAARAAVLRLPEGAVESSLSAYFLARNRGRKLAPPVGYIAVHNDDVPGVALLHHKSTGVMVKAHPLCPTGLTDGDDTVVVYHYTTTVAFKSICQSHELWATLLRCAKNDKDTCFGDGLYTTERSPDRFGSIEAILINNYTNALESEKQQEHIAKHLHCAACCIPVIVPRTVVYDVHHEATPEKCCTPGIDRHGRKVRLDRDIQVVVLKDVQGEVQNVKETVDTMISLLEHLNEKTRKHAVRSLGKMAAPGDSRILDALLQRLAVETEPAFRIEISSLALQHAQALPQHVSSSRQEMAAELPLQLRAIVLEAVKSNGAALQYASEELRADRTIVLEAVKNGNWILQYASEELRADRAFVLEVVKSNGFALQYFSEELRADRAIVLEAVKCKKYRNLDSVYSVLSYASQALRADREIVLEAVKYNNNALWYASEGLRASILREAG